MKPITVKELEKACKDLVKRGYGDKKVYLSEDDEGNGYHQMFYTFTTDKETMEELDSLGDIDDYDNSVILG